MYPIFFINVPIRLAAAVPVGRQFNAKAIFKVYSGPLRSPTVLLLAIHIYHPMGDCATFEQMITRRDHSSSLPVAPSTATGTEFKGC